MRPGVSRPTAEIRLSRWVAFVKQKMAARAGGDTPPGNGNKNDYCLSNCCEAIVDLLAGEARLECGRSSYRLPAMTRTGTVRVPKQEKRQLRDRTPKRCAQAQGEVRDSLVQRDAFESFS
jgi:hypothetical protein